ncbi:hypothetical protein MCOR02_001148 [Pyricularia oryzae]|nr:hypothetical protein MCOR02_001148 [Pyricularia oryzae]
MSRSVICNFDKRHQRLNPAPAASSAPHGVPLKTGQPYHPRRPCPPMTRPPDMHRGTLPEVGTPTLISEGIQKEYLFGFEAYSEKLFLLNYSRAPRQTEAIVWLAVFLAPGFAPLTGGVVVFFVPEDSDTLGNEAYFRCIHLDRDPAYGRIGQQ